MLGMAVMGIFTVSSSATDFVKEYSLSNPYALSAGSGNGRLVITSESNAWAPSSNLNPYTKIKGYDAFLPPCSETKIQVCIQSVETKFGDGQWVGSSVTPDQGLLVKEMPTIDSTGAPVSYKYSTWEGDLANFLPPAGNVRLWKSEDPSLAGTLLRVIADVHGAELASSSGLSLQATLTSDKQTQAGCSAIGGTWNQLALNGAASGSCDYTYKIPSDLQIRVKLKFDGFTDPITGWFTSTVSHPVIDFTDKVLTVEGGATAHASFMSDPIPYISYCETYRMAAQQNNCPLNASSNGNPQVLNREWGDFAMAFSQYFQQKSLGEINLWAFESSLSAPFNTTFHNLIPGCTPNQPIFGVISTDASLYSLNDLSWNSSDQTFGYSVFSPHLNSNSAPNKGFFALQVDRKVAECLWKKDLAGAKAELSINYQDGTSEVATTTLGSNDKWVTFQAAGFHYSQPKFIAKIVSAAKEVSNAIAKPIPLASQGPISTKKVKEIICLSPNRTLKVHGPNPKCPKGYKLK